MLSVLMFMVIVQKQRIEYYMIACIGLASFTFYNFTIAVINMIKYKKQVNPIYAAVRRLDMVKAVVSVFTLQVAMLTTFAGQGEVIDVGLMNTLTGIAVTITINTIGAMMIAGTKGDFRKGEEYVSDFSGRRYGKSITEQTRRLSALVTNILKLNKLENQKIYPNTEVYDISEQLCECMLEHEAVWEEKGIEIETDIQEALLVEADKEQLSLVWNNLFSNALKFTEAGGCVSLRSYGDEYYVYIEVKDTGCGMGPETGANIFKKFYQGDTSHSTKGNGLGLALVKRVIDICKGEISVISQLGKGSTFTVRLNRKK